METITFDPILAGSIWLQFTAIRSRIPSTWINLDGRRCWVGVLLVALAMQFVHLQASGFTLAVPVGGTAGLIHAALEALVLSVGAIIIDGGAYATGMKDDLRRVLTIGVTANAVGESFVAAAPLAAAVAPEPAKRPIEIAVADVQAFMEQYRQLRTALQPLLTDTAPPDSTSGSPGTNG